MKLEEMMIQQKFAELCASKEDYTTEKIKKILSIFGMGTDLNPKLET